MKQTSPKMMTKWRYNDLYYTYKTKANLIEVLIEQYNHNFVVLDDMK